MQTRLPAFAAAAAVLCLAVLFSSPATVAAHNVTRLLAKHPQFTTFNHYLSLTHLAEEINRRTTVTVCAVDNAAMADVLAKHPSLYTVKNILSVHVLLDYFNPKKLHQINNGTALYATLFQATGSARESTGLVNITDEKGGKVAFGPQDNDGVLNTYFVKSLVEVPYNISIIQISKVLPSHEAEAPTPGPAQLNLTQIMSAHGCKVFADTLSANPEALKTYQDNIEGGLTVFCPMDDPFKAFLPKYKNLTAAGKESFLEFFAVPLYESMSMLRSNNGPMNTLATDGESKYDFTVQNDGQDVTLKTRLTTAKITGTLFDQEPVAIYSMDKVLMPKELFKGKASTPSPAPAPAAEKAADAPKAAKKSHAPAADNEPAAAPSPDEDPADQTADNNSAVRFCSVGLGLFFLSLCLGLLLM